MARNPLSDTAHISGMTLSSPAVAGGCKAILVFQWAGAEEVQIKTRISKSLPPWPLRHPMHACVTCTLLPPGEEPCRAQSLSVSLSISQSHLSKTVRAFTRVSQDVRTIDSARERRNLQRCRFLEMM